MSIDENRVKWNLAHIWSVRNFAIWSSAGMNDAIIMGECCKGDEGEKRTPRHMEEI